MIDPRSRYHPPAEPDPPAREDFDGTLPRSIGAATPVLEHRIAEGDRLDLLARHYYNDDRLWWRIVDANPDFLYPGDALLDERVGKVLLIPRERE